MRKVWITDRRTGERTRQTRARFDVRYRADGHDFRFGFDQRGWADSFVRGLHEGYARGLLFDPRTRRFVELAEERPEVAAVGPTVVEHFIDYVHRKWATWEPATRPHAQRDLSRAALTLLRENAPPLTSAARRDADSYLRAVMTVPPARTGSEAARWEDWLAQWSLPLSAVTDAHLQAFLDEIGSTTLDGHPRRLAPASVARTRAVVRAAFTYARQRRLIAWDPWEPVHAPALRDHDQVDPDLVMSPPQVRKLARACAAIAPQYELYVLIQGFCGLRPGEASELRRRDLEHRDDQVVSVNVSGSYSTVPERFLDSGESRRRPLKGRGPRASRTIPVPQELKPVATNHLRTHVSSAAGAYLFTTPLGKRINPSNFQRDVWRPARQAVFDADDPLASVRRHDLRHAAITAWLNAGVPLKTAQAWSGHRTASVLLDTYLGVMRGDEELAVHRFETLLRHDTEDS